MKKTRALRFALRIHHAPGQRAPRSEGHTLRNGLIAMKDEFAGQSLFLVQETQDALLARLEAEDPVARTFGRKNSPVVATVKQAGHPQTRERFTIRIEHGELQRSSSFEDKVAGQGCCTGCGIDLSQDLIIPGRDHVGLGRETSIDSLCLNRSSPAPMT